jgi:cytohesin
MLAFSLIMLNTDLHNPSIKNKMTKEQFVKNNTGTGLGEDLPREFLLDVYQRILEKEIKMEAEDAVFGNALVQKSGWLTKQGGRVKTWKRRWFILSGNVLYYFKEKVLSTHNVLGALYAHCNLLTYACMCVCVYVCVCVCVCVCLV